MIKERRMKRIALMLAIALIVSSVSGFSKSETVKAEEVSIQEETGLEQETTGEGETEAPDVPDKPEEEKYTLVAHRGYSGYAPENSMPAFEKAIAAGFTTIELDIRRCRADSKGNATWVISHDDSLKGTMGVDKKISELTYEQILTYSYTKGNEVDAYRNLKIVSYEQIIQLIKKCKDEGLQITWQIEIKDTDDENYTDYFEEELIKPLVDAGIQDCIVFSSFNATYLKKIKTIDAGDGFHFTTWYLSTVLDESAIKKAKSIQASGISFKGNVNYNTQEQIQAALEEGFRLGCYTVNSTVIMGAYYKWGVRNFATNYINPMEVYEGMLTGTYNVRAFTCKVNQDSYTYDGTRKLPNVTVTYKGVELIEGLNYELSYENNKYPGTASVYITGMNNCFSESEVQYQIIMPKVTGFNIKKAKTTYVTLSWSKVKNATGYIVYQYNFSKKKYEAIKTISKADTVTYKVKKLTAATKYKFRVKAYLKVDNKTYNSAACSAKTTYTRPAKSSLKSLTRYKKYKRLRIKWNKVAGSAGYYVVVATDKKMKNIVGKYTVKGQKNCKLKVKKLKEKQTYYVKVRAYLNNGSGKTYGVYSPIMKSKGKNSKK